MQLSRCCHPVPGDRILGYITRGRGLTIHAVDCPNLEALDYDKERLVEVEWDAATPSTHSVKMSIVAVDKTGVLANVSSAIAECHANISRAEITTREDQKAVLDFVVEVSDTHHLDQVLKAVERVDGVITARRCGPGRNAPSKLKNTQLSLLGINVRGTPPVRSLRPCWTLSIRN